MVEALVALRAIVSTALWLGQRGDPHRAALAGRNRFSPIAAPRATAENAYLPCVCRMGATYAVIGSGALGA